MCLAFSAKGAVSIQAWGTGPGAQDLPRVALQARFNSSCADTPGIENTKPFLSRAFSAPDKTYSRPRALP